MFDSKLLNKIRARFCYVDECPYSGARIFFENAGGSLTLKSVVEVSARLAAVPDNQGRANAASQAMDALIKKGREDMFEFLGAPGGDNELGGRGWVFVGDTGTDCLYRAIRAAVLAGDGGGNVVGSTLEHPATSRAAQQWAKHGGYEYILIKHNDVCGSVAADDYARNVRSDTKVATVIHTSPVTGISVNLAAVVKAIRAVAPACFIVVDGIQHAPHGAVRVGDYDIDAYAVSAYKIFSRHNYGLAWLSGRLQRVMHDELEPAAGKWELGTRDVAEYATFSEVVSYLKWLGGEIGGGDELKTAAAAIAKHEKSLTDMMLRGGDAVAGLAAMDSVMVIGGADNPRREGVVSFVVDGIDSATVVRELGARGIRVHIRVRDCYAENILTPLGVQDCIRTSICHYNSADEVMQFLKAMGEIVKN